MLYISTKVWVLRNPYTGQNSHFQRFLCKKAKKCKKFAAKFCQKQVFFKFAPEGWLTVLFTKKLAFFSKNLLLPMISCELLLLLVIFGLLGVKWSKYTTDRNVVWQHYDWPFHNN